jgi:hypothetical protein
MKAKIFIAPVRYTREKSLKDYMNSLKGAAPAEIVREAAHALFFKRRQFALEKEFRIVYVERLYDVSRSSFGSEFLLANDHSGWRRREELEMNLELKSRKIPVDPECLIRDVMIGPVSKEGIARVDALKRRLMQAGYKKVRRSLIYQPPD